MDTNVIRSSAFQKFNTVPIYIVNDGQTHMVDSNCADIVFTNETPLSVTSNGEIWVNNKRLSPGQYIAYNANDGEINMTAYIIIFNTAATRLCIDKRNYTS